MATEKSLAYRIHLHERGPTSAEGIKRNLKLEEVPKLQPGTGQVLVRMKAAALNCRSGGEQRCLMFHSLQIFTI